jgi:4-diphosphocytidyl-2C-methyl-D-erythritol kinase
MAALAVLAIVGAGMQAYSQYQSSQQQAENARIQAKMQRQQAKQLLELHELQKIDLKEQGEVFKSQQMAAFAAGGVAVGTGSTLSAMEDTNRKIIKEIEYNRRETMFKVGQIKMGADLDMAQANDMETAGKIQVGSTLLTSAGNYYMASGNSASNSKGN